MWIWRRYRDTINKNCLVVDTSLDGLAYWRNQLFCNIMLYFAPLSVFSVVPGIIMSFKKDIPVLGFVDLAALFLAFFISLNSKLKINARKVLFISLLYLMAMVLIYYLGSFGPGLLYLLVITIFCIIIFSNKHAYISVVANVAICILFGFAIYFKLMSVSIFTQYTVGAWIAVSINLVIVSTIMAVLLPVIFTGMQQSNNRFEMVARATTDTVCDWDLEKNTKLYNTGIYHVFGYAQDEVEYTGEWWLSKIHHEDLEKVKGIIDNTLKKGGFHFQTEYRFKCADDSYKYILYRSYVLRDENKKAVRIISSMQDITERNNYIRAIEEQNRKLKDISWTQSHVVRAPLTRIMGLVNVLMTVPAGSVDSSEVLEYIMISANEFDDIIKGMVKNAEVEVSQIAVELADEQLL
jgi:PAS domain S-box-containing protein